MHDFPSIFAVIRAKYELPIRGYHGVSHWARVCENGLRIAENNGADPEVISLFALFHDSRRENEGHDPRHGLRGAELANSLRGVLVHLDDARFELLYEACRLHTAGFTEADPTIAACWDADRLDLGRVGVMPRVDRLCTDAARQLVDWANLRACSRYEPGDLLRSWDAVDLSEVER